MENKWLRKDFAEKCGTTDRKVLFYTEQGMFPDLRRDVGRGAARIYTTTELRDLKLILELTKNRLPLNSIKAMIKYVHEIQDEWLPNGHLIDKPFFVEWDLSGDKPFGYSISSGQAGEFSKTRNSLCVLIVNLTAIFLCKHT
jgi:hypothetical protein